MTAYDDFDRTLAGWLETDSAAPVPRGGLHHVIDATQHRKPRPGWLAGLGSDWVGEAPDVDSSAGAHTPPLLGTRGSIAIILLLATVAIVGGAILVGALVFQPPPLPTGRLGHLAYGLDGDIYVAAWDGANPVRIADGVLDPGGGGQLAGTRRPAATAAARPAAAASGGRDRCGLPTGATSPIGPPGMTAVARPQARARSTSAIRQGM